MKRIMMFCLAAVLTGIWSCAAAAAGAAVTIQINGDGNFQVVVAEADAAIRVKNPSGQEIYIGDSAEGESQTFIIPMDGTTDETGEYVFTVNGEIYTQFYANNESQAYAIESVNAAQNAEDLGSALQTYWQELALEQQAWDDMSQWGDVYENVLKQLPYEGDDAATQLRRDIRMYTMIDGLNKAATAAEVKTLIDTYNEEFLQLDMDETSDFGKLEASYQEQVFEGMLHPSPAYSSVEDVKAAYTQSLIVPLVNGTNWSSLETVLRKYSKEIGISFIGDFAGLNPDTEAPEVFKQMKNTTYQSTAQIAARFNQLVVQLKGTGNANTNVGGGGSGGGGGRGNSSNETIISDDANLPQPNDPGEPSTGNLSQYFNDMQTSPWAATAVDYLAELQIVSGNGAGGFEPERSITREEFLKILLVALELEGTGEPVEFSDVDQNAWYAPYISTAKELGITSGMGDGTFGIGQQISRQDMAVFAYRAMGVAGMLPEAQQEKVPFTDEALISDYAVDAAYQMQQTGILSGMGDGSFAPVESATRAQAAKMVYEMIG